MPTINLTRSLVADIKKHRSGDYLELAQIDPNEQNIPKLTRLLGKALQLTTTLKVLELTQPSPELITLVAQALNRPRCRLENLLLRGLTKAGLAEISQALSHFSSHTLSMTTTGIVGTSCQNLIITFTAQSFVSYKLSATQISHLATLGLPALLYPPICTANVAAMATRHLSPRQPVVADHSLSLASHRNHSDSLSLREHLCPATPCAVENLAIDEINSNVNAPCALAWNPWPSLSSPMAPLLGTFNKAEAYSPNTLAVRVMRWNSVTSTSMPSRTSAFSAGKVKPLARLTNEDRQQAILHEHLLSETTSPLLAVDSPKHSLPTFQARTAACTVVKSPPASHFLPVASLMSAMGQLSLPAAAAASTAGHTLKHPHLRYSTKVVLPSITPAP